MKSGVTDIHNQEISCGDKVSFLSAWDCKDVGLVIFVRNRWYVVECYGKPLDECHNLEIIDKWNDNEIDR